MLKEGKMFELINQLVVSQYLASLKSSELAKVTLELSRSGEEREYLLVENLGRWLTFVSPERLN